MSGTFYLWALLFVGNAALCYTWLHCCVKVLRGQCPHCGK